MEVKFIYLEWGSADLDLSVFLKKVKEAGYDGVELGLPLDENERDTITQKVGEAGLTLVSQHYHTDHSDFKEHKASFEKYLRSLAEAEPLLINSHTGKNYFSFSQNAELLRIALNIEKEYGVVITHETHRSRFSFAAHVCKSFLEEFPSIKLTADLSHWCNVAESMLRDQKEAVRKAIDHTHHIHARVGSTQTAQVIDPRDGNYAAELDIFKKWWAKMYISAKERGLPFITITPEYGPAPYSFYKTGTKEPIADQWEVNQFIRKEIEELLKIN